MPTFIPFELPTSKDGNYIAMMSDESIFQNRRILLGMSQKEVAEKAGVPFRQYQRLEAGDIPLGKTNTDFALGVCAALLLDPYEMTGIKVKQPDPASLKPQITIDTDGLDEALALKRPGRKPIRRNHMNIYLNYNEYSIIIPYEAFGLIGNPEYFKMMWKMDDRMIAILATDADDEDGFDVPKQIYEKSLLALPALLVNSPISAMNWGRLPHVAAAKPVIDKNGTPVLLIDLNGAKPYIKNNIAGVYMTPDCFMIDDGEAIGWDEED